MMTELSRGGKLNLECLTVTGGTIGENIQGRIITNEAVIHKIEAPIRKADINQRFLSYQKVFSRLMMLDSMAGMFDQSGISLGARMRALPLVGVAMCRRARRMSWRRLAETIHGGNL